MLYGTVLATCKPRHRHQEFLSFLQEVDKAVPAELDIPLHRRQLRHAQLFEDQSVWLKTRKRWHMHFIATYSSWLNQVERSFALLLADKAIRRGSFTSVKQLL